jgi:hypothetical protein
MNDNNFRVGNVYKDIFERKFLIETKDLYF